MYGMIMARERNFLHGKSERTISQASAEPSMMLITDTVQEIISEFMSGLYNNAELTSVNRRRFQ